jgi:hypothetical protein
MPASVLQSGFAKEVFSGIAHTQDIYSHFGAQVIKHRRLVFAYRNLPTADDYFRSQHYCSLLNLTEDIRDATRFAEQICPLLFWTISRGWMSPSEQPHCVKFLTVKPNTRRLVRFTTVEGGNISRIFMAGFVEAVYKAKKQNISLGGVVA